MTPACVVDLVSEVAMNVAEGVCVVVVSVVDVVMAEVVVSYVVDDSVVVVVPVVVLAGVPIVIDHAVASPVPTKSPWTVTQ